MKTNFIHEPQTPVRFRLLTKRLGGFRLPTGGCFIFRRDRDLALLEAGAAPGIAALQKGRCQSSLPQYRQASFSVLDVERDDRGELVRAFAERAAFEVAPTAFYLVDATDLPP